MPTPDHDITRLLTQIKEGSRDADQKLLPLVYDELKDLARAKMAGFAPNQTIQCTALVHEAYLKLWGTDSVEWETRGHFFAAAARAMRNILVDQARSRARVKRGGGLKKQSLEDATPIVEPPSADMLALDEALNRLHEMDPQKCDVVMLRFFGGLSSEEAGKALGISKPTTDRHWKYAKAWLHRELRKGDSCVPEFPA